MLIVHIGTPKTGTKALQIFLARQSKTLAKQGILYLKAGRRSAGRKRPTISHSALAKSLWVKAERETWKVLRAELERSICQTNIISAEAFWFNDPAELRAELPESQPVRLVVYLRRQDRYLQSLWKQAVVGGRKSNFKEWRRKRPTRGDYLSTIQKWVELFGTGSVLIRPYDKDGKINTVEDFCEIIGAKDVVNTENTGRNPSPRRELAHLIRALNHMDLDVDRHQLFRAIVQKSDSYVRTCDLLSYDECLALMAEHAESNRILIEKYYRGAPFPLFPELLPFEPEEIWDPESEEFRQLTTDVLRVLVDFATSGKMSIGESLKLDDSISDEDDVNRS